MKSILISFLYLYLHFYDLKAEKLNNYNCREIGDMTNNINNKPFYSMKIFSCMIPYNEEALIKIDSNNAIATIPNVTLPNATQQLLSNVTIPNAPSPVPNAPSSVPNAPSSVPNAIEPSISPSSITLIEEIQEIQEDIQKNETLSKTDQAQHNLTLSEKLTENEIIIIVVLSVGLPFVAGVLLILFIYQKKCKIYCKKCCNRYCKKCCKNKVRTDVPIIDLEEGQNNEQNNEQNQEQNNEQKSKNILKNNPTKINRRERRKILLKKVSDTNSNETEETVEQKTLNELN